jgi:hypothetical protein
MSFRREDAYHLLDAWINSWNGDPITIDQAPLNPPSRLPWSPAPAAFEGGLPPADGMA